MGVLHPETVQRRRHHIRRLQINLEHQKLTKHRFFHSAFIKMQLGGEPTTSCSSTKPLRQVDWLYSCVNQKRLASHRFSLASSTTTFQLKMWVVHIWCLGNEIPLRKFTTDSFSRTFCWLVKLLLNVFKKIAFAEILLQAGSGFRQQPGFIRKAKRTREHPHALHMWWHDSVHSRP